MLFLMAFKESINTILHKNMELKNKRIKKDTYFPRTQNIQSYKEKLFIISNYKRKISQYLQSRTWQEDPKISISTGRDSSGCTIQWKMSKTLKVLSKHLPVLIRFQKPDKVRMQNEFPPPPTLQPTQLF